MLTTFTAPMKSFMVALPLTCTGGTSKSLDCTGNKPNVTQACHKISGTSTTAGISSLSLSKSPKNEQEIISPPMQLLVPNDNNINGKSRQLDNHMISETNNGRLLKDGLLFQQNFTVRSFEIGSNFRISIEALMNYLQETSLNHLKSGGLLADGFGSTSDMSVKDLIWVVYRSHIEVDHHPSWADVVQVEASMSRSGKNTMRRDTYIRDFNTGTTLIRATSLYAMMNKKTRKFAKVSKEVIEEMKPFIMQCDPAVIKDSRKLVELDTDEADYIRTGLTPGWTDMDVNQHVSHIKLVNYLLESVPRSVVENHELSAISLEFRRECNGDDVLQSLSKVISSNHLTHNQGIEFDHLLRLESGPEILRGRTRWRLKYAN